jgi:uncharacterized protein
MKMLFWLAIVIAVVWLMRSNRSRPAARDAQQAAPAPAAGAAAPAETMLQCSQCGVYLPASEAVHGTRGETYCCEAHRAAHSPT